MRTVPNVHTVVDTHVHDVPTALMAANSRSHADIRQVLEDDVVADASALAQFVCHVPHRQKSRNRLQQLDAQSTILPVCLRCTDRWSQPQNIGGGSDGSN